MQKQNKSRRVYGEKITHKIANMETKDSIKLQKKLYKKITKTPAFRNNATDEIT